MRTLVIVFALVGAWWTAAAAQDYPYEQFLKIQECAVDPSCPVHKEDRISGPIADAEDLTDTGGVCISGCMTVCVKDGCWCEIDDKCKR